MADTTSAAPAAAPKTTTAPIDLAILKDDLNIPATDTSQDAWLQRRADGVWARMESFTMRRLCVPPVAFIDDWSEVRTDHHHINRPPAIAYWRTATAFLRYYPVSAITAVELNGTAIDLSNVTFDARSGKLFTLDVPPPPSFGYDCNLGHRLLCEQARITYAAGWDAIPPDLYQALLGVMQVLWNGRQSQLNGLGGAQISDINVIDVGAIKIAGGNDFIEFAARTPIAGQLDPLLGPWAGLLTDYIDWRGTVGSDQTPTTSEAP